MIVHTNVLHFPVVHMVIRNHVQELLRDYKMMSSWGGTVCLYNSQSEGRGRGDCIIDVYNSFLYIFSIRKCD